MKRLLYIIVLLSSCEQEIIPRVEQDVDPELQAFFDIFYSETIRYGCEDKLDISYSIILSDDLPPLYCAISNKGTQTIIIDEAYIDYPRFMEFIMIHECGHYFLDLEHNTSLVMKDGLCTELVKQYCDNREYALREFFNSAGC